MKQSDPQSKTVRTILEEIFDKAYKGVLDDSHLDLALSDISKIIDEAKPDTSLHGCERCWSDDFKAKCTCDAESNAIKRAIDQYHSNLKERLG